MTMNPIKMPNLSLIKWHCGNMPLKNWTYTIQIVQYLWKILRGWYDVAFRLGKKTPELSNFQENRWASRFKSPVNEFKMFAVR